MSKVILKLTFIPTIQLSASATLNFDSTFSRLTLSDCTKISVSMPTLVLPLTTPRYGCHDWGYSSGCVKSRSPWMQWLPALSLDTVCTRDCNHPPTDGSEELCNPTSGSLKIHQEDNYSFRSFLVKLSCVKPLLKAAETYSYKLPS